MQNGRIVESGQTASMLDAPNIRIRTDYWLRYPARAGDPPPGQGSRRAIGRPAVVGPAVKFFLSGGQTARACGQSVVKVLGKIVNASATPQCLQSVCSHGIRT
jgi:hypothetical protein